MASACGSTSVVTPAGPSPTPSPTPASPRVPSLIAGYTGGIGNEATGANGFHNGWGCHIDAGITAQTGGDFSGWSSISGNGASSDAYCTIDATNFSGHISEDGSISLRFDRNVPNDKCSHVSSGLFTGTYNGQRISAQMTDHVTCVTPSPEFATVTVDRAWTLTVDRRKGQ
jgi:hypothetical protein